MKHIFSILTVASLVAFGTAATSCVEEIPEVMDELALGRCLSPSNPVAKVVNGEYVEFSWDKTLGSEAFVLELYSDEAMSGENLLETFTLSVDEVPYTAHLEADMIYYARVKGTNEGVYDDSKWTNFEDAIQTYAIKSSVNPEVVARTKNSITITWTLPEGEPETPEIDHLVVSPAPEGNESGEVEVTSAALAAGQIEVTGLKSSVKYNS